MTVGEDVEQMSTACFDAIILKSFDSQDNCTLEALIISWVKSLKLAN